LLIDANLRQPRQHKIFNLRGKKGLSDIMAGRAGLDEIVKLEGFHELSVLGSGAVPPNPQELLSGFAFSGLMAEEMANYDIVLVDTSSLENTADTQAVLACSKGALLISRINQTGFGELTEARDEILLTGAQIVGAIVNDF
jgi:capsular exopolysaccharide synthesis family protein